MRNRLLAIFDADGRAIDKDFAFPAAWPDAEQALHRFGTPCANQPGDAEDLTATQAERDVINAFDMAIDRMPGGEVFNAQDFIVYLMRFVGIEGRQLAPYHHGDNVAFAHLFRVAGADMLTITDNADSTGDRLHFVQLVRDIYTGDAVMLKIANNIQQYSGFLLSERRGGFIKD